MTTCCLTVSVFSFSDSVCWGMTEKVEHKPSFVWIHRSISLRTRGRPENPPQATGTAEARASWWRDGFLKHCLGEWAMSHRALRRQCCNCLLRTDLYQKGRDLCRSGESADWHSVQIEDISEKSYYPMDDKDTHLTKQKNHHILTSQYLPSGSEIWFSRGKVKTDY